jgi:hypothetical protein
MNTATQSDPRIRSVNVTDNAIVAHLIDGRVIRVPLKWSWRLSHASRRQRENYRLIGDGQGVHWPDVDEDISVEGMLRGIPAKRPSLTGIRIEPTELNFQHLASSTTFSKHLKNSIQKSSLVVVPHEGFGQYKGPVFPVQTDEFWNYLQSHAPSEINVELGAEENEYKELALHGDIVRLAMLLVRSKEAHLIPDLLVGYLKNRLGNRFNSSTVLASVIVDQGETKTASQLSYEGPVPDFGNTLKKAILRLLRK